jgi:hypothetical protein
VESGIKLSDMLPILDVQDHKWVSHLFVPSFLRLSYA